MDGNTVTATKRACLDLEALQAKTERVVEHRTTKKINVDWLENNGRFVGDKIVFRSGGNLLAFVNAERPKEAEDDGDKVVITLNCRFFDGKDIRGKVEEIPYVFSRDDLFKYLGDVEDETNLIPIIREHRRQNRMDVKDFVNKSMAKVSANPWLSHEKRCDNLMSLFGRIRDKKFDRYLREFVVFEALWEMANQ